MKQAIISKLGLKPTNKNYKQSSANGIVVYLFENDIYCAACTQEGLPTTDGQFVFFKNESHIIQMHEDFVLNNSVSIIRAITKTLK